MSGSERKRVKLLKRGEFSFPLTSIPAVTVQTESIAIDRADYDFGIIHMTIPRPGVGIPKEDSGLTAFFTTDENDAAAMSEKTETKWIRDYYGTNVQFLDWKTYGLYTRVLGFIAGSQYDTSIFLVRGVQINHIVINGASIDFEFENLHPVSARDILFEGEYRLFRRSK